MPSRHLLTFPFVVLHLLLLLFFAECFNYAIRVRDLSTLRIQKILFCCFSSEVVWVSIEKSGSALKSPDRMSTYNLLTNVKMDPKNLYLFPWDQASTMMLMLLFVGHVNKYRKALVNNLIKKKFYGKKKPINVLTAFFISHKSDAKTFLKWILNQCPHDTC